MEPADLSSFIGRRGLYIEDGTFVLVRVRSTTPHPQRMIAEVESVSELVCDYRQREFTCQPCPFGETWSISHEWTFFCLQDDHWDASLRLGIHIIFSDDVIRCFENRDLSWTDRYF